MGLVITPLTTMSKPFHQTAPWQKLSKDFKTLRCVDCGSITDIEAGHILPAANWKMSRLWRWNLVHQCHPCNAKLGCKIRWSIRAIQLLLVYGAMKFIYWGIIIIYFALTTTVMYRDLSIGGLEVSITGQVIFETTEQIQQLWE